MSSSPSNTAPPPATDADNNNNNNNTTSSSGGAAAASTTVLSAAALELLEQRYYEVMRELGSDPRLLVFKTEYEKAHRLLLKSVDGEKRLLKKNDELQRELDEHKSKIGTAMDLSEEDEKTILNLKKEIEKAWAMADSAHTREKESKEMMNNLKKEVAELDKKIEQNVGFSVGKEAYVNDLLTIQKEKEEEHAVLTSKLQKLSTEHHDVRIQYNKIKEEEDKTRQQLEQLMMEYQSLLADLDVQKKERTAKEQNVKEYRENTEKYVLSADELARRVQQLTSEKQSQTQKAAALAEELVSLQKQIEEKQTKFKQEADRMAATETQNAQLLKEIPKKDGILKEKQRELKTIKKQKEKLEEEVRTQQQQLQQLVDQRAELVQLTDNYNKDLQDLVAAVMVEEKSYHALEAELRAEMQKKSKTLSENAQRENARAAAEGSRVSEEGKKKRLLQELENKRHVNETLRKQTFHLESLQNKEERNAQGITMDYHRQLDQIRNEKNKAKRLQLVLEDHEKKLKLQQELLDRVLANRNRAERQWKDCETEKTQLQQRYASKTEEINDLKNELINKEGDLYKLYVVSKNLGKEIAAAEVRARHLQEDKTAATLRVSALEDEALQLHLVINKCEEEKQQQEKRLKTIRNERNTLATEVLHKDEELRLLYSKLELQQSSLQKGAAEYEKKLSEIEQMRSDLAELRLRCRLAIIRVRSIDKLKKKEGQELRQLRQEQARSRLLTEELHNSVNVHRWRQLEGTAPELMDLIEKIHLVQQKVISKHDEVEATKKKIEAKDAEYNQLRQQLARLPGPEAAEELALFEENVSKRQEQIMTLEGELKETEQEAEQLADEVQQLNVELSETKQRYFEAKTKHDLLSREQQVLKQTWGGSGMVANLATRSTTTKNNNNNNASMTGSASRSNNNNNNNNASSSTSATAMQHSVKERKEKKKREEQLLEVLSSGAPVSSFPLAKPVNQKQFAGGGFALQGSNNTKK